MRSLFLVGLAVLASFGAAQVNPKRQAIIDAVMQNRLSEQADQYFDNGEFPRVIELLKVNLEMTPDDYDVATSLGWMLESTERFDEALATYVSFRVRNGKTDPDAAFPEANFYFTRRNFTRVVNLLEPTVKRKPHGNSFRILAHSYDRIGMLQDSLRVWDDYLKIAPGDGAAKRNRDKVANKLKQPK